MPATSTTKRVTLKEVAARAGVSIPAVSAVLGGASTTVRIPDVTEERIREAAEALGYIRRARKTTSATRPSAVKFKSFETPKRTNLRVVVIGSCDPTLSEYSQSTNPWDHDIVGGVEAALARRGGVRMRFLNRRRIGKPPMALSEVLSMVQNEAADAIVVIDMDLCEIVSMQVPELEATGLPFVIVSAGPLGSPAANVCYDNKAAGYQAAMHLISEGHRELTYLAPIVADWTELRLAGAREAVRVSGLPEAAIRTVPTDRPELAPARDWVESKSHFDASVAAALADINAGFRHCAVIAMNDETALGYLYAAEMSGLRAFEDFALVGFDDIVEARMRGISTLRAPREEMGREAAFLLHEVCTAGIKRAAKRICLQSDLVVRASSTNFKRHRL